MSHNDFLRAVTNELKRKEKRKEKRKGNALPDLKEFGAQRNDALPTLQSHHTRDFLRAVTKALSDLKEDQRNSKEWEWLYRGEWLYRVR